MTTKPLVSIITPTRNYGHFLGDALTSVVAQTYPNIECVIIDDGSTDNTPAVIDAFEDRLRLRRLRLDGVGLPAARNAGIDIAAGEFALFLDADDVLMPGGVTDLVGAGADVAIGQWRNFADAPAIGAIGQCQRRFSGNTYANVIHSRPVAGCAIFRKELGRFDASRRLSELLDYLLRVGKMSPSVAYVDRPVIGIRQHVTPHRLTVAHDHFEPSHRLAIVKAHRPGYVDAPADVRAALDHLTLDLVLQLYRVSGAIDPVARDIDLNNIAAHGILPPSWQALRFGGFRLGAMALRTYERLRA